MLQGWGAITEKNLVLSPQIGAQGEFGGFHGLQFLIVTRKEWQIGLAVLVAVATVVAFGGVHFWKVRKPPSPPAAKLPPSARVLFQPFRKDSLDLTLAPNGELQYRIAQSSGWYRWRWNNPTGDTITIHLQLGGYYEPPVVPSASMPYDR
jgi:hypothetical protein